MAITPNSMILPQYVRTVSSTVTSANTTYSGTSLPNLMQIGPTGPNGSLLRSLKAIPLGTVTATQLQLFKFNGTFYYLVDTALMPAYTLSTTTQMPVTDFGYSDNVSRYIGAGTVTNTVWTYYVGISVASTSGVTFTAEYGDY